MIVAIVFSTLVSAVQSSSEENDQDGTRISEIALQSLKGRDRIDSLLTLSKDNYGKQPEVALNYALEAAQYSTQLKDFGRISEAEKMLAWIYLDLGQTDQALISAQNSYRNAKLGKNNDLIWQAMNVRAVIYSNIGLYDLAIENYLKSLSQISEETHALQLAHVYNNIAVTYYRLKNWEGADHYYSKAHDILARLGALTSVHYSNLGEAKMEIGDYETAIAYFDKAKAMLEGDDIENEKALILSVLGDLEMRRGNLALATKYLELSISICDQTDYQWLKTRSLRILGEVFSLQENWSDAILKLDHSLDVARQIKSPSEEMDTLTVLFKTLQSAENPQRALDVHIQLMELKDSIDDTNDQNRALIHRVELEIAEKERIIDELKIEQREARNQLLLLTSVAGILVTLSIFVLLLMRYKHLKRMKRETERNNLALRHANQVKNQFLSMIGHEFRTPINEIVGLVNMELKNDVPSATKLTLETVSKSAYQLSGHINDLLDIIKIGSETIELQAVQFSISRLIDDTIALNKILANEKGIRITKEVTENTPRASIGDPLRLKQILNNLVHNAVKFTDTGCITVKCEVVEKDAESCKIKFSVIDTGIGVHPTVRNQLFEVFTQADSATSRKNRGLGLGLSISQNLLSRMNSHIEVQSEEGKGSTFSFEIQLKNPPEVVKQTQTPSKLKPANYSLRVLLVEDGKVNQKIAKYETQRLGHQIEAVENGQLALEVLEEKQFDIILMDIDMPVLNGIETTRRIRSKRAKLLDQQIYICAFTASAMHGDRERFLSEGMNDYVSKPVRPHVFAEVFERAYNYQISRGFEVQEPPKFEEKLKTQSDNHDFSNSNKANESDTIAQYSGEVIRTYLKETLIQLERIANAIKEKDAAKIRQLSLTIAGSAGYLNENHLVETCIQMEAKAVLGNFDQIEELCNLAKAQFLMSKIKLIIN